MIPTKIIYWFIILLTMFGSMGVTVYHHEELHIRTIEFYGCTVTDQVWFPRPMVGFDCPYDMDEELRLEMHKEHMLNDIVSYNTNIFLIFILFMVTLLVMKPKGGRSERK